MEVGALAMQIRRGGGGGSRTMEIRWASRRRDYEKRVASKLKVNRIPIYISTNPSHIDPTELRELYRSCNHSCHRFPHLDSNGKVVEAVDLNKLCVAVSHSSVVVSVFCNLKDVVVDEIDQLKEEEQHEPPLMGLGDLLRRLTPLPLPAVSPSNAQLVGFGRAVSDFGLTASIYDVMVIPSLRSMGIGTMIVKRIVRMLTNKDIYDISAVCTVDERLFFKACGFGDDMLGSTTMMYTRAVSTYPEDDQMVKCAGRKLLLAPPFRKHFEPSKTIGS